MNWRFQISISLMRCFRFARTRITNEETQRYYCWYPFAESLFSANIFVLQGILVHRETKFGIVNRTQALSDLSISLACGTLAVV